MTAARNQYRILMFGSTIFALIFLAVSAAPSLAAGNIVDRGWWTPAKAQGAVVATNPQGIGIVGHHTTITSAMCVGVRPYRLTHGSKLYATFSCAIVYQDDSDATGPRAWGWRLFVSTSPAGQIACWDRSLARLKAKHCR